MPSVAELPPPVQDMLTRWATTVAARSSRPPGQRASKKGFYHHVDLHHCLAMIEMIGPERLNNNAGTQGTQSMDIDPGPL